MCSGRVIACFSVLLACVLTFSSCQCTSPPQLLLSCPWFAITHQLTTIDTEMKAKRDNVISELITLRIAKAKAKANSGRGVDEIHLKLAVMQKLIGIKKFKKKRKRKQRNMSEELISL